jgi:hypothetical protein
MGSFSIVYQLCSLTCERKETDFGIGVGFSNGKARFLSETSIYGKIK